MINRLFFLASKNPNSLLDNDQIDERKQYSAIDAVMTLIHDIQLAKSEKLVIFVVFMNIKDAFDHVSSTKLLKICQDLKLPKNLILWINCFLNDRSINLSFDGESEGKKTIRIEIPQGSPISPILFLIYIKFLFEKDENLNEVRTPSYIDDIGLVVSSKTVQENCQKLKIAMREMLNRQESRIIQFDMEKTQLIHFM